jgi:hypothetical protein
MFFNTVLVVPILCRLEKCGETTTRLGRFPDGHRGAAPGSVMSGLPIVGRVEESLVQFQQSCSIRLGRKNGSITCHQGIAELPPSVDAFLLHAFLRDAKWLIRFNHHL